ncbi:MAG: nuclear transport factor 2 family protein [Pseudomonadota bacterium]
MIKKTLVAGFAVLSAVNASAWAGPVEEMMETDRAFAAMAARDGVPAAFAAYAAEDVRMFPGGSQPYAGRDTLIERYADFPNDARLEWDPVEGMASPDGDFGFTWGRYVYTPPANAEGASVGHGKYVSIWRREDNGDWKFVADIGNSNPDPDAED